MDGGHSGQAYTLTGSEALTPRDMIRTISAAAGRDIPFIELTEEQARRRWAARGYPDDLVAFIVAWYAEPPAEGYTVSRQWHR